MKFSLTSIAFAALTFGSLTAQNKIVFSSRPFSQGGAEEKEFKAGGTIYGRIILDKPLKAYCNDPDKKLDNVPNTFARQICLIPENAFDDEGNQVYDEVIRISTIKYLKASELNNSFLDFDIMPSMETATSVYSSCMGFGFIFAENGMEVGKKKHYGIKLYSEYNESNANMMPLNATGDLYIDYTSATSTVINNWWDLAKKACENAEKNVAKNSSAEGSAAVKSLPLPKCFSIIGNPGYKAPEYSNAAIIAMIKKKYGITEVLKLTFDKSDGAEDFRSLVDASTNIPSCKMGNHVFYFAFKDKDGTYRFSGGVLKKDYEGYGKYGETYILNYSPIQGEEKYPLDMVRENEGTYGVFIFDGAKLK
jgi:hypothetical protein